MESYQVYNLIERIIILLSGVGAIGVVGWTAVAWRRVGAGKRDANPELLTAIEELRSSVDGMREGVADIADRLEFTERAMAQLADPTKRGRDLPGN